ncbi:MAG: 4-hydroxy-2-oxovalerate aldolase, partial [Fuerstiella sp.]|nr:4-hydroxy-2-oxovalerate aldolase [Fuerstiella sp.]
VGTIEDLVKRQAQGGQLLAHGGDFGAMMKMLKSCGENFSDNPRGAAS